MRACKLQSGAAMLLIAVSACAHAQPEIGREAEAYVAPKLIGCSGYVPPAMHWIVSNRVMIQVKVQPDGSVDKSSPRYRPSHFDRGGESAVVEALSLADNCVFEPAYVDQEPVEAWTTVRFAFR